MSGSFRQPVHQWRFSLWILPFLFVAVGLLLTGALRAAADAPAETKAGERQADDDETELQQAARKMAEGIKLAAVADGKHQQLEMLKQPVLRFGDIPRANDKGSVWIWHQTGRPQAIMELYRSVDSRSWVYVIHSLSADALDGDFGEPAPRWTPTAGGVTWNTLAAAQPPAERPAARARQLKELAQKFAAHEFWDPNNSRHELRLLVQPVQKYNDPEHGLLDGALFLLCHETNPEVALLIEAVQADGEAKFRYALARLGHAELHVAIDEKEVWRQERIAETKPTAPYWLYFRENNP